jgi:hypothetical protein
LFVEPSPLVEFSRVAFDKVMQLARQ